MISGTSRKSKTIPTPINTVYVDVRLENWRGEPYQTCTVRLLAGSGHATVETPTVVDDKPDPRDPTAIVKRCTFSFASPISDFRIRIEGSTDNVLARYLVAERVQVSLAI